MELICLSIDRVEGDGSVSTAPGARRLEVSAAGIRRVRINERVGTVVQGIHLALGERGIRQDQSEAPPHIIRGCRPSCQR